MTIVQITPFPQSETPRLGVVTETEAIVTWAPKRKEGRKEGRKEKEVRLSSRAKEGIKTELRVSRTSGLSWESMSYPSRHRARS